MALMCARCPWLAPLHTVAAQVDDGLLTAATLVTVTLCGPPRGTSNGAALFDNASPLSFNLFGNILQWQPPPPLDEPPARYLVN